MNKADLVSRWTGGRLLISPAAVRWATGVMLAVGLLVGWTAVTSATTSTAPTVSRVSAAMGPNTGGTRVTVTGRGFIGVTRVNFGATAGRSLKVESATKLLVTTPAHSTGLVDVRVVNRQGTSKAVVADRFTYTTATLKDGQELYSGQVLWSTTGKYEAAMQTDGNFVVYGPGMKPSWASGTSTPGSKVAMQTDGNLVIYTPSGTPVWSSNTAESTDDSLTMQTDGNLVLYGEGGRGLWDSNSSTVINTPETLTDGQTLGSGQALWSVDGKYEAVMQTDGNFVVYGPGMKPVWASGTSNPKSTVSMQADGNLVIYTPSGSPVWSSNTAESTGDSLVMQTDGNLVLYSKGGRGLWDSNSSSVINTPETLADGQTLGSGQALWSIDGQYEAVMQTDGNFVLYEPDGQPKWDSGTGTPGSTITMQADGNLVIYSPGGSAVWSSTTAPSSGDSMTMQTDGNLVIYDGSDTAIWASGSRVAGGGGSVTEGTWPGSSGPVAANQQFGYPYPNAPACTDGGACDLDAWDFDQGQCTSWVAYQLNKLNGVPFSDYYKGQHWGNATDWGSSAEAVGIAVNGTPAVGSVAWYEGSSGDDDGHVAYVEQVLSPTQVVISEMNYDFDNGFRVRTITTSSGWPTDFIHIT